MSKELRMGYYGEYYWSGRYWYIAQSVQCFRGKQGRPKKLIGSGNTKEEAYQDLQRLKNEQKNITRR